MSTQTAAETIQHAKKAHRCDWCAEKINIGDTYERWRWFDGGDAGTAKMHPECANASSKVAAEEGWDFEYYPGMFRRGCGCDPNDPPCDHRAHHTDTGAKPAHGESHE